MFPALRTELANNGQRLTGRAAGQRNWLEAADGEDIGNNLCALLADAQVKKKLGPQQPRS